MINKNKILKEVDGATGIKTGYTKKAGRCLVSCAKRNGMEVICVVLNCPAMFEDSKTHLNDNGKLYIVIKKDLGANSAIKKLSELFNNVEIIKKDKGYFIIKSSN